MRLEISALAALLLVGCSQDLNIPDPPERGTLEGVLDTEERLPLVGHEVTLVNQEGTRLQVLTDDQGAFSFGDLLPATYFLEVELPGFATLLKPNLRILSGRTLDVGVVAPTWLATSEVEAIISGKVVINGDGSASGGEVAFLKQPGDVRVALASIGIEGDFVQRVPPGTYRLRISHPNFVTAEAEGVVVGAAEQMDLSSTPIAMDINPATIVGRVLRERDQATPAPAADAIITLGSGATTTTDANGDFVLQGLAASNQTVRVSLPGHHDEGIGRRVELLPGETSTLEPITVRLDRGGIAGEVVLADQETATDVRVSLTGTSYAAVVTPDAVEPWRGRFAITGVPVGTYELTVNRLGYSRGIAAAVAVTWDATTEVGPFTLTRLAGEFTIEDTDATNAPGYTRTRQVTLDLGAFVAAAAFRAGEEPSLAGLPFQAFTGSAQPFELEDRPGTHVVYAQYRDASGATSGVFSASVVLDAVSPEGSLVLRGTLADGTSSSERTATADVTLSIGRDDASELLVIDGLATPCPATGYTSLASSSVPHTLGGSGEERAVTLCLRDRAGNVSDPISASITFDPVAPSSCMVTLAGRKVDGTAAPAGKTASAGIAVTLSGCVEQPAEVHLSPTPVSCAPTAQLSWQPYAAGMPFVLSGADGDNAVYGCARDATHHVAALTSGSIALDTTPPMGVSVVLDSGAQYVNAQQVSDRGGFFANPRGHAPGAVEWAYGEDVAGTTFLPFNPLTPVAVLFGGDGVRTVAAVFRDEVGNVSQAVSDSIEFDVTAPDLTGVTLAPLPPAANGYSPTVSIQLSLDAPADAATVQMLETEPGTCATADFTGAQARLRSPTYPFLLTGGDEAKEICARLLDAAQNPSAPIAQSITLDTLAPAAPRLLTSPAITAAPNLTAFEVNIAEPVSDTNFARYERLGGLHPGGAPLLAWEPDSTDPLTTTFTFLLESLTTVPRVPNTLRLRAVDLAGNASPEASVVITTDIVPPGPVMLNPRWVSNGSGLVTLHWAPPTPPGDVAGYRIFYANVTQAPGYDLAGYTGTYALQGVSPIEVGNVTSTKLSNLPNGAVTYVTVRAVDAASNVGPEPFFPTEVALQPNVISPDLLSEQQLSMTWVKRLAVYGHYAYAFGVDGDCAGSVLQPVDLRTIVSPLQSGTVNPNPPQPSLLTEIVQPETFDLPNTISCDRGMDMVVDGPWLFTAAGMSVRIYSLVNPEAPTLVSTTDFSGISEGVYTLAVRGHTLFVGYAGIPSRPKIAAIDLASLYDDDASTVPGNATIIGHATGLTDNEAPVSLTLTRDRLVMTTYLGGPGLYFNITDAVDESGATAFDDGDYLGEAGPNLGTSHTRHVASGNFLYNFSDFGSSVVDLTPLWSPTFPYTSAVAALGSGSHGQADVQGSLIFTNDLAGRGVRIFDASDLDAVVDSGLYRFAPGMGNPTASVVHGNYLLTGTDFGKLAIFEVAAPRSMHTLASTSVGGWRAELHGGFLYNSTGEVIDLHSGRPPSALNASSGACHYDGVRIGETMISANSTALRVHELDNAVDRDPATTYGWLNHYPWTGVRVTGLARVGHLLIAAEVRAPESFTPGVWLRIIDARKLLRAATISGFDPFGTDSLADFQVTSWNSTYGVADVSMHLGRALVTLADDGGPSPATGAYVVDLRPLLDDDATTTLTSTSIQASLPVSAVREGTIAGDYAYLTTQQGLSVVEIPEAMDDDVNTEVPATPAMAELALPSGGNSLSVQGSYAFVTPYGQFGNAGMRAIDISSPLQPKVVGFYSYANQVIGCGLVPTTSTVIAGSRAYLTSFWGLNIVGLE